MTFEEFWKEKSGWFRHGDNMELSEGTSEYNLAQDAYNAGVESYRARVDAEMARLRDAAWERFDNAEVEERAIAKLAFNDIDAASARLRLEANDAKA